jgi:amino acid transporter
MSTGTAIHMAGPGGALVAFFFASTVAYAVMQCIAEMICIWPISGALIEFVRVFVDEDLGTVVGIAYW